MWGDVEANESAASAALRETMEEGGIEAAIEALDQSTRAAASAGWSNRNRPFVQASIRYSDAAKPRNRHSPVFWCGGISVTS